MSRWSLLVFGLACTLVQASQPLYRWTDAQGVVQFSDVAPAQGAFDVIQPSPPALTPLPPPPKLPKTSSSRPTQAEKRRAEQIDRQLAREQRQLKKRCRDWQRELEHIQQQLRAGYREPKGNRLRARRRMLSDWIYEDCR